MSWEVEQITITKNSKSTGEANVKLVDEDDKSASLYLNKLIIDLHNGKGPINIARHEGTPVFSGTVIDNIKEILLDIFQNDLSDMEPGLYKILPESIEKLG